MLRITTYCNIVISSGEHLSKMISSECNYCVVLQMEQLLVSAAWDIDIESAVSRFYETLY